jgi:hypothetical protein
VAEFFFFLARFSRPIAHSLRRRHGDDARDVPNLGRLFMGYLKNSQVRFYGGSILQKLFIYTTEDPDNVEQAERRFADDSDLIHFMPIDNSNDLIAKMSQLVKDLRVFDRVLFQTHGVPGGITINKDEEMGWPHWDYFKKRQLYKLFPVSTRIYFDGCNVGKGQDGEKFLIAVGQALLYLAGGSTFAFDSPGWVFDFLPVVGAETTHFGNLVRFDFDATGKFYKQSDYDDL